ncbi:helix-turn-helix transcriptional regulator [Arthrobacter antioxidans]|uniref:helix-turn-helix transcriptional regulator n=1 Tax=Arthrobacter antioxidans TaxID=2895818 RepID=UPI002000514C|nr:LuxR C-terminal-related transcriptional regulator [Arthrobacter antioxidans]
MASEQTSGMPRPVLAGKLTPPWTRPRAVTRVRLLEQLADPPPTPLTVVVAPAGWGKTTVLAQWASEVVHRPIAWVTLDEGDDDPVRFWTYVAMALDSCRPGLGRSALAALAVPQLPPVQVAVPALLNALMADGGDYVLVLDDYHVIDAREIHEGLEFALAYLPANIHVVLSARADPALPLARFRARGQLTEIRAAELAFTADEATGLVTEVSDALISEGDVAQLVDRTEGWAAGLHLAALTLRGATDPARRVALISGDDRHILDYLSGEVLGRLEEEHRRFLVELSPLDRLGGDLCDAALGCTGSAQLLEESERSGLFLTALDDRREWYRCHRLFRESLRRELEATAPGRASQVLAAAARWWQDHGDPEAAARALLDAGHQEQAAELILDADDELIGAGGSTALLALADRLERPLVDANPRLAIAMAAAAGFSGQFERVDDLLGVAEAALAVDGRAPRGWSSAQGAIGALRVTFGSTAGAASVLEAQEAARRENNPALPGYVIARLTLGLVLLGMGEVDDAIPVLHEASRQASSLELPAFTSLIAAGLLATALLDGSRTEDARAVVQASARAADALEAVLGDAAGEATALLRTAEGRLAHDDGEPLVACAILEHAARLARAAAHPSQTTRVLVTLADARLAVGDRPAARAALTEAREVAETEWVFPATRRRLLVAEDRIGRGAARAAHRRGALAEELTERELSVLRALQGSLSQREIGRELFLSINTVKGYTKSLYRKLDVVSRADAVSRGRELGLI